MIVFFCFSLILFLKKIIELLKDLKCYLDETISAQNYHFWKCFFMIKQSIFNYSKFYWNQPSQKIHRQKKKHDRKCFVHCSDRRENWFFFSNFLMQFNELKLRDLWDGTWRNAAYCFQRKTQFEINIYNMCVFMGVKQ